jgi:hypothetical protein
MHDVISFTLCLSCDAIREEAVRRRSEKKQLTYNTSYNGFGQDDVVVALI